LWLRTLLDSQTGRVPNLGANDGAHFLDLTDLGYLDYRPTVQAVGAIVDRVPWLPLGPWDELAFWLEAEWPSHGRAGQTKEDLAATVTRSVSEEAATVAAVSEGSRSEGDLANASGHLPQLANAWGHFPDLANASGYDGRAERFVAKQRCFFFPDGGYAVFRDDRTVALFRCPQRFRHRPAHCDLLHFDLWHKGTNVLRDSGTYSYNCDDHWQDYFSGTAAHNTVQFDEHDQMPKLSRFLFGRWPTLAIENELDAKTASMTAQFTDWRGCQHRRTVAAIAGGFRIIDRIRGYQGKAVLRWRLAPDWTWEVHGDECRSEGCTIRVTAQPGPVTCELTTGWESLHYFQKTEIPVLQASVTVSPQEFTTEIVLRK
jgi:hypothetical protein